MQADMRTPGSIARNLGLMPEPGTTFPTCSLASRAPKIKAVKFTYLSGKDEGELVKDGKLTPGQTAVVHFGSIMPRGDILVGLNPALLGVAVVGNPVLIPGTKTERSQLIITVEAKKAINLAELDYHICVSCLE